MRPPFPSPTQPRDSRAEVLLSYLDYFRFVLIDKLDGLPESELRSSRLPSGWTPLELLMHVTFVERRWLVWGFEGEAVDDPWGDRRENRWHGPEGEDLGSLVAALHVQAARTRSIVEAHALSDVGQPSERWDGEPAPTLERILLHLLQEYARHVGHLDVVRELIDGKVGK